jgi:Polysaccharide pyruvyl transferase
VKQSLRVRYIGWQGHGNVGDDLLFELWRNRLHGVALVVDPADREVDAILVGGGTLLLQPDWISVFERACAAIPAVPWFGVGLGAQDPTFCPPSNIDNVLERWRRMLPSFQRLSLRGPLSSGYMDELGMSLRVTGDPGLLTVPEMQAIPTQPHVAINLAGGVAVGRFGAPDGVLASVARFVSNLRSRAINVSLLPLCKADIGPLTALSRLAGPEGIEMTEPSISGVKRAIAKSTVVVCERLHAGCLAAVTGVPFVQLAYQPKCFDFTNSLNWPHAISAGALDADDLTNRTTQLIDSWVESAVALTVSVARVRRDVAAEVSLIEDEIRELSA